MNIKKRLGRPRKTENEKRLYVGVSLSRELVVEIDKLAGEKYQFNRSAACEHLLASGLLAKAQGAKEAK